jgi:16S rRNA (uracil1498-N3)-methyltransferase
MSPIRLFSPLSLQPQQRITLDAAQTRYLKRALRLRLGDAITLFDGSGGEYPAKIVRMDKSDVDVQTGEVSNRSTESTLRVRLVQGISKGERMDTVVQKATELGVTRVSPVLSQYSVIKLDDNKAAKRRDHWQKVAQSACEQCGRNVVPGIDKVKPLISWHAENNSGPETRLILVPDAATKFSATPHPESDLTLLIGPEGGFSNEEQKHALENGFRPISLGPRILRTETAATAAIAVAQALWGDFA